MNTVIKHVIHDLMNQEESLEDIDKLHTNVC